MKIKEVAGEFERFILKGNVVDLAVGVVIGGAFGKVVDSMVKDVITPFLALFGGEHDFSRVRLGPIGIGNFFNQSLSFVILGAVIFFLVVKPMNALQELVRRRTEEKPAAPTPLPEDVKLLMEIRDLLRTKSANSNGEASSLPA